MPKSVIAVAALAVTATFALAALADAAPTSNQRVAVESTANGFVLIPLVPGALRRDSGTDRWTYSGQHATRDGQDITINEGDGSLVGKRGTIKAHFRNEWVEAGHRYSVSTGRWTITGGTGDYSSLTGRGRSGGVAIDGRPINWRWEGVVAR